MTQKLAVHPRWRGEQADGCRFSIDVSGSSPLARGTGRCRRRIRIGCRFIPAGAGNRKSAMPSSEQTSVHPRWRGEQFSSASAPLGKAGSSPLARGTGYRQFAGHVTFRFIPAGAGNRHIIFLDTCWASVHPRWRGEQGVPALPWSTRRGSSPLARGTVLHAPRFSLIFRFIPAGAGNSWVDAIEPQIAAVHPRWRGEQDAHALGFFVGGGSSPLARGTG